MALWWSQFEGKVPGIELNYPEEHWIDLISVNNTHLHTYRYPAESPRAIVFLFHGMYSHANSQTHIARRFAEAGITALSMDQENHGKSGGQRGKIRNLEDYVNNAVLYIELVKPHYPGLPIFVLGESMGGYTATSLSLKVQGLRGMMLMAPAYGLSDRMNKCMVKAIRLIAKIGKGIKLKKADRTLITRNPHVPQAAELDPLGFQDRMDAGSAQALLRGFDALRPQLRAVDVPFIIALGEQDKIVSKEAIRKFEGEASSSDKRLIVFPDMYHAVCMEPEIDEIIEIFIQWCSDRME